MKKQKLKLSNQQILILARKVTFVQGALLEGAASGKVRKSFLRRAVDMLSAARDLLR